MSFAQQFFYSNTTFKQAIYRSKKQENSKTTELFQL